MFKSPVYHVIPVPIEKIKPNTYNPNAVAPPEMKLLYDLSLIHICEGLRDLADHWSNVTILADKGYVGKNMKQEMQEKNICLFALKRSNKMCIRDSLNSFKACFICSVTASPVSVFNGCLLYTSRCV